MKNENENGLLLSYVWWKKGESVLYKDWNVSRIMTTERSLHAKLDALLREHFSEELSLRHKNHRGREYSAESDGSCSTYEDDRQGNSNDNEGWPFPSSGKKRGRGHSKKKSRKNKFSEFNKHGDVGRDRRHMAYVDDFNSHVGFLNRGYQPPVATMRNMSSRYSRREPRDREDFMEDTWSVRSSGENHHSHKRSKRPDRKHKSLKDQQRPDQFLMTSTGCGRNSAAWSGEEDSHMRWHPPISRGRRFSLEDHRRPREFVGHCVHQRCSLEDCRSSSSSFCLANHLGKLGPSCRISLSHHGYRRRSSSYEDGWHRFSQEGCCCPRRWSSMDSGRRHHRTIHECDPRCFSMPYPHHHYQHQHYPSAAHPYPHQKLGAELNWKLSREDVPIVLVVKNSGVVQKLMQRRQSQRKWPSLRCCLC